MVDTSLAATSNTLFTVAFVCYLIAMVGYFFRLAFTRVSVEGVPASTAAGRRVGTAATVLASGGALLHLGSLVTRGLAAERMPIANMYEYSSWLALLTVAIGLVVVQRRMGYGNVMGFLLALAVLQMTSALLLFAEASPVVPALRSYWINIHVSAMMTASSILIVAFGVTALYLVKDAGERRVAARSGQRFGGSTVGAAQTPGPPGGVDAPAREATAEPDGPDAPGHAASAGPDRGEEADGVVVGPLAQREALSPVAFPVVPFVVAAGFTLVVWRAPVAALVAGSVAALLGVAAWYAVPYLPPAAKLDSLAYRVHAFAFPVLTFGVIAGAIWAQEAWGRYWGWDPKETGSFFTWVLYAGYLHARSTRGWRGRRAAWVAVVGFAALMVTYYAVNLFVVGLHSYAGV
jgi:cytochrome c-type biogenesis protein CcsB